MKGNSKAKTSDDFVCFAERFHFSGQPHAFTQHFFLFVRSVRRLSCASCSSDFLPLCCCCLDNELMRLFLRFRISFVGVASLRCEHSPSPTVRRCPASASPNESILSPFVGLTTHSIFTNLYVSTILQVLLFNQSQHPSSFGSFETSWVLYFERSDGNAILGATNSNRERKRAICWPLSTRSPLDLPVSLSIERRPSLFNYSGGLLVHKDQQRGHYERSAIRFGEQALLKY